MVILGFAIAVFVKQAIVNRNAANSISPEQSNQVDARNHFFLFAETFADKPEH